MGGGGVLCLFMVVGMLQFYAYACVCVWWWVFILYFFFIDGFLNVFLIFLYIILMYIIEK